MKETKTSEIKNAVADYYSQKIREFGTEPRGVDWNSDDAQLRRFAQVCKVITEQSGFSILDFGCGYGALHEFLVTRFHDFNYFGFDISNDMIEAARKYVSSVPSSNFSTDLSGLPNADFVVASGIFNVKGNISNEQWIDYIRITLASMNEKANKGFSFNCLTNRSDKPFWKDHLFYADPAEVFAYCQDHFSRHCSIMHDYGMFEFTIIVRRKPQ